MGYGKYPAPITDGTVQNIQHIANVPCAAEKFRILTRTTTAPTAARKWTEGRTNDRYGEPWQILHRQPLEREQAGHLSASNKKDGKKHKGQIFQQER